MGLIKGVSWLHSKTELRFIVQIKFSHMSGLFVRCNKIKCKDGIFIPLFLYCIVISPALYIATLVLAMEDGTTHAT